MLKSEINHSRNESLLDSNILAESHVAFVGTGGAASLAKNFSRLGVGKLSFIEKDEVSATNPATQSFGVNDIGISKAEALESRISNINPATKVATYKKWYQDLSSTELDAIWSADIVLGMTDSAEAQYQINRDAIVRKTDAIFAICYIGCEAIEVTGTFPDQLQNGYGCHLCHTKARADAISNGFKNPETIPSHLFAAEALNNVLGFLTISRLHHKNKSPLPISGISEEFVKEPCFIQRIGRADYWAAKGEPFSKIARSHRLFTTQLYALDTPEDWVCPDCGTVGVIPVRRSA